MISNYVSFESRIKENIVNYDLDTLFDTKRIHSYLKDFSDLTGAEVMLTNRDGNQIFCAGNFKEFNIDVVGNPGRKIMVKNRTVAHLYVKDDGVTEDKKVFVNQFIDDICRMLVELGQQSYMYAEAAMYISELEENAKAAAVRKANAEKIDSLTETFNATYFKKRMEIIDRSEIAPVAIIEANINDWRYANGSFGDAESDRLIRIVADILRAEAKPEYVIGRTEGDVFVILIPMPEDGEAEDYISRIQNSCDTFVDKNLTPSVACGLVYKTNVEEKIQDLISDAEYLMFENKLEIKASMEYQRRLHRTEV